MNKLAWLNQIEQVIAQGPFSASMASLKAFQTPGWYLDGKFGIFIHWGPYCVPAFESEWYARNMYQPGSKAFNHHVATYGPHKGFGYKDFIPLMTAGRFDPAAWAQLFVEAGARFVVPVAEHHDGFQMYESSLSRWNAKEMGPGQDIVGLLREQVTARGLTFGLSSHRAEHWWFMDGVHKFDSDYTEAYEDFYGPAMPGPEDHQSLTAAAPSADFLDDWLIRCCELVDLHRPQLVWFDWWIQHLSFRPYLEKFAAYYYNRGAQWGLGVAINHKFKAYDEGCAVLDVERGQFAQGSDRFWQNDTAISKNSWGYVTNQDYKEPLDILCDLCDVVSKNGALLLNIGPRPDGSIPEEEQRILKQIGAWLKHNGEAIYGSRPWRVFGEGPTQTAEGSFTDTKRAAFTGQDIRYTLKDGRLYAIVLGQPEGDSLLLNSLREADGFTRASSMDGQALKATQEESGLRIQLSDELRKAALPLVVKLEQ